MTDITVVTKSGNVVCYTTSQEYLANFPVPEYAHWPLSAPEPMDGASSIWVAQDDQRRVVAARVALADLVADTEEDEIYLCVRADGQDESTDQGM